MNISQITVRRISEQRAAEDEAYRRLFERNGRPFTWDVKRMSDEELVAKLRAMKLDIDRPRLAELSTRYVAAYQLANTLLNQRAFDGADSDEDWAWFAIEALWQRWFPDRPNLEMVDDQMQAGYDAAERHDSAEACRRWRSTWLAILDLMQRFRIKTISSFDTQFRGTQYVFNWVQDYESELYTAGRCDAQFLHDRIALCQTVIERFDERQFVTENFRRALAESYFELGQPDTGDRLFRQWLDEDPRSGWTWISWSDCHYLFAAGNKDADRALQILHQGLSVAAVRDRSEILSRMESVLTEVGRDTEAAGIRRQREQLEDEQPDDADVPQRAPRYRAGRLTVPPTDRVDSRDEALALDHLGEFAPVSRGADAAIPVDHDQTSAAAGRRQADQATSGRQRVGRNDSCPCGSGKKFKKCCGRRS